MTIFLKSEAEAVFIRDQQHSELFSLNCFFCSWKYICNSKGILQTFLCRSQFPFRPFLLKETWLLTIHSHVPGNIWKSPSNKSLYPPLFPCVSHHVGKREAADWCWKMTCCSTALPLASSGLRFPTKAMTHLYKIIHIFFICNTTSGFDMKRECGGHRDCEKSTFSFQVP